MSRRAFLYPVSIWNQINRAHGFPFSTPRHLALQPASPEEFFKTASAFVNSVMPSFFENDRHNAYRYVVMPKFNKTGFEVKVNVNGFRPEDLEVKTVDNCIVVEGKHEEKPDEEAGFISRSFVRRYVLPDSIKPETVNCSLSSDGYLVLSAPLAVEEKANERQIPIAMSGEPVGNSESEAPANKQETVKANEK